MRVLLSFFKLFLGELIWKISPLVICKILGVFLNTLTSNDRYPVQDYENLRLQIQMQLSLKRKSFF